ncbi:hypothetical protein BD289DRAFT_477410 [Coniella lustricola]|uniref:SET domain-containing protein n=1 Tax=Coniella lustricola TaxID=2025994 RepID=A0A2T2ZUG9_9PEZI|nr:hypothetical protein BD289DRAFT_477410 [Coniella lustricola]
MADLPKVPIWQQPDVCKYIIESIDSSTVPLQIKKSSISGAGSGLFTTAAIKAGTDVFWSIPRLDCQSKAWKAYHKHECSIFKRLLPRISPGHGLPALTLCRLTIMCENKLVSEAFMAVLFKLSSHFTKLNEGWYEDNDEGVSPAFEIANVIRELTNPKDGDASSSRSEIRMSVEQLNALYCVISCNGLVMNHADTERVYGSAIDLAVSVLNHSCEPNVHIYFEPGRKLRCRALKNIGANSELTIHYYAKPVADVLLRQQVLTDNMYFDCKCMKCWNEMDKHKAQAAILGPKFIDECRSGQERILRLTYDSERVFASKRVLKTCLAFQERLGDLVTTGYPSGERWPNTLAPLSLAYRSLGCMYRDLNYAVGLELVLRGTLHEQRERNPDWPSQLHSLVRYIYHIAQADDEIKWVGVSDRALAKGLIPGRGDLRDLGRGYHMMLCRTAKFIFGLDCAFVRAVYRWLFNFMGAHGELGEPETNPRAFAERYNKTQQCVLEWAQTDDEYGIKLPSAKEMRQLKADYAIICGTDKEVSEREPETRASI